MSDHVETHCLLKTVKVCDIFIYLCLMTCKIAQVHKKFVTVHINLVVHIAEVESP